MVPAAGASANLSSSFISSNNLHLSPPTPGCQQSCKDMKTPTACTQCRRGKRRCTIGDDSTSCNECLRRSAPCSLASRAPAPPSSKRPILPHHVSQPAEDLACDARIRVELGRLYISLIHDKPHTLFHPPTFMQQLEDGSVPLKIMYGVFAMVARFSSQVEVRNQSDQFLVLAKEHLKKDVDKLEIETIQASVIVGNTLGWQGSYDVESLYFGIAFRMAQILDISKHNPSDDQITQEIKLRVWWSLYMIDRWSSAGNGLRRELQDDIPLPLPMDESHFDLLLPRSSGITAARPGLWGYMIQLAQIFGRVQDLHRQHVNHFNTELEAERSTLSIEADLDSFINNLPPSTRFTEDNLRCYSQRGLGSAFVALHLGYHHYSTLLYFHYLDLQLIQSATVVELASKCRRHAAAYSDLLELSTRIPGCEVLYFIVAHMTVVSSAALLHTLLFGESSELQRTRERLKFNFEVLVQLRRYWPAVSHLMERLFVFQNACLWSVDPNTHRVDRWMLRFLLQHALPVPAKHESPTHNYTLRGEYADDAMAILKE